MKPRSFLFRRSLVGLVLAAGWAACAVPNEPVSPAPIPTPRPTTTVNTPPTIHSISVSVTRAEVDQPVDVTADVTDVETPVANLTFVWSANAGAFTGAGRHVTWLLPKGSVPTPVDVVIMLTVVETFPVHNSEGTVLADNRVSLPAAPFRAHDSVAEITKMSLRFLVDLFGNSSISPTACLVDFWDDCTGKAAEQSDIEHNRATFVLLGATATVASITFKKENTGANVVAPCIFHDREIATGIERFSEPGSLCLLTAVYVQQRWWLCTSGFQAPNGDVLTMREFFIRRMKGGPSRE